MRPLIKPAAVLGIAVLLFFVNGTDAVLAFLNHEFAQEWLGSVATILALVVGVLVPYLPKP